jgi:N-acetylglutamate synthase-like GNAT family acetyltransferase
MLLHLDRMSAFDVRRAVADDLPALRRIFRQASLSNEGDREVLLAHPEALELRDEGVTEGRIRAATTTDGSVVGFITIRSGDGSALELEDLFVDPEWMRRGVARSLLADVVATAKHAGSRCIEVTGNPHAEAFYRSVGFEPLHECETPFGPGLRMRLAIPNRPGSQRGQAAAR